VLVVGGGNSATDLSVEAGRFAKSSHIRFVDVT
jgi:cation diffusion facilitator CzcD-associated flavoprotein CzcO